MEKGKSELVDIILEILAVLFFGAMVWLILVAYSPAEAGELEIAPTFRVYTSEHIEPTLSVSGKYYFNENWFIGGSYSKADFIYGGQLMGALETAIGGFGGRVYLYDKPHTKLSLSGQIGVAFTGFKLREGSGHEAYSYLLNNEIGMTRDCWPVVNIEYDPTAAIETELNFKHTWDRLSIGIGIGYQYLAPHEQSEILPAEGAAGWQLGIPRNMSNVFGSIVASWAW
jgi:hypothetical protein